LVLDALEPKPLRTILMAIDKRLHMNDEKPPRPLGSRNLLQRVVLVAVLVEIFRPETTAMSVLVAQAESKAKASEPDLQTELEGSYRRIREEFSPLAFLYDLRTHGGLAHHPNIPRVAIAATELGLPDKNWHRTDYLRLLNLVTDSIYRISRHLRIAASI
jgi:hypothetical protein